MKYLITESQAKIAATFHKLDMKKFIQIERDGNIYFVKSEWDEYAQIRYHPKDRWCTIHYDLADEVSKFFSLDYEDSINVINDEYAQIRYGTDNGWCFISVNLINEISSLFSLQESDSKTNIVRWVENTLQMEVKYTIESW